MARKTILVVDDQGHIMELAQLCLEQAGFWGESASGAEVSIAP
jgi:CheY-like chemotaxis protein